MHRILSPVMLIALVSPSVADVDRAQETLDAALSDFDRTMNQAAEEVVDALNRGRTRAQKAGNLEAVEAHDQELQAFHEKREVPSLVSTKAYVRKSKRAMASVIAAYESAIEEYTRADQIDLAKELRKEMQSIRATGAVILGPLQVGSVWVGETRGQKFTVTKRTANHFQARFQGGRNMDRLVSGTASRTALAWRAADVVVAPGRKPGGDNWGKIIRDEKGYRIDMEWKGPGDAGGKFTLRLVEQE